MQLNTTDTTCRSAPSCQESGPPSWSHISRKAIICCDIITKLHVLQWGISLSFCFVSIQIFLDWQRPDPIFPLAVPRMIRFANMFLSNSQNRHRAEVVQIIKRGTYCKLKSFKSVLFFGLSAAVPEWRPLLPSSSPITLLSFPQFSHSQFFGSPPSSSSYHLLSPVCRRSL